MRSAEIRDIFKFPVKANVFKFWSDVVQWSGFGLSPTFLDNIEQFS